MKKALFVLSLLMCCVLCVFSGCQNEKENPVGTSVVIDGVKYTKIENGYEATKIYDKELEEVILLEDVDGIPMTSIGVQLFKDSKVNNVVVPNNVETIKGNAFANCKNLKTITISNKINLIENDAFYGCSSLVGFYYNGELSDYCKIKFVDDFSNPLFYAKRLYINGEELSNLDFTDDIETIKDYAFAECYSITHFSSNNKIKSIGYKAFRNCINLESDIVLDYIQNIDDYAFSSCDKINNVEIGSDINEFGKSVFTCDLEYAKAGNIYYIGNENNPYLIAIDSDFKWNGWTVPNNSCRVIAPYAFAHDRLILESGGKLTPGIFELSSSFFPSGLRYIGENAFSGWNIQSIHIPSSIKKLGKNPFGSGGYERISGIGIRIEKTIIYYSGNNPNSIGLTPQNVGRNFRLDGYNWDRYWQNPIINGIV